MFDHNHRKQMIYRSNHRGIKEMDIILGRYANAFVMDMSDGELEKFKVIMDELDRDLLTWFTGEVPCPGHLDKTMFQTILDFTTKNAKS